MSDIDTFFAQSDVHVEAAKNYIRNSVSEDSLFGRLSKWIVQHHDVSYSIFLDYRFASLTSDALGMSSLLHTIHHAMFDDGVMSFVDLGTLGPRAVFFWSGEPEYNEMIRGTFSTNGMGKVFTKSLQIGVPHEDVERFIGEMDVYLRQSA